jgi:tRNA(Ile)-lysidine synthase TilS/MesJ
MRCDTCGREAVLYQNYSGLHLCREHFTADLEAKVKRAIRTHRWLHPHDHIGVLLSGGAAGSALLFFFKALTARRRDVRVSAIIIDEGIRGYRIAQQAQRVAESLGADYYAGSFEERFGITMDEIVKERGDADACLTCRVLREALITGIARQHGITKIACGTSLDDGAREILLDVLTGRIERAMLPCDTPGPSGIPVIRPFMYVPKGEIERYAKMYLEETAATQTTCSHAAGSSLSRDTGPMLDTYNDRHPATMFALVNLREHLSGAARETGSHLQVCATCGEPVTDGTCDICRIRGEFTGGIS